MNLSTSYRLMAAFLLLSTVALAQQNYWVAPDGWDGNPGSSSSPFRTIQKAVDSLTISGTIHVRPGVYCERVIIDSALGSCTFDGIPHGPLDAFTIEGTGPGPSIITLPPGRVDSCVFEWGGNTCLQGTAFARLDPVIAVYARNNPVTIRGLTIDGALRGRADNCTHACGIHSRYATVEIDDCEFRNIASDGLTNRIALGVFAKDGVLSITNSTFNLNSRASGINFFNVDATVTDNRIVQSGVSDFPGCAVAGGDADDLVRIERNIIEGFHRTVLPNNSSTCGIVLWGPDPGASYIIRDNQIRNCQQGIRVTTVPDGGAVIEGNTVLNGLETPGLAAIQVDGSSLGGSYSITGNTIGGAEGPGIQTDQPGGTITNNTLRGNNQGLGNALDDNPGLPANLWDQNSFDDFLENPNAPIAQYAIPGLAASIDQNPDLSVSSNLWVDPSHPNASNTSTAGTTSEPLLTIQDAINRVTPNATIFVAAGTYTESLLIDAPANGPFGEFTIRGTGIGTTILQRPTGPRSLDPTFTHPVHGTSDPSIRVDGAFSLTLRGFTIQGSADNSAGVLGCGVHFDAQAVTDATLTLQSVEITGFNAGGSTDLGTAVLMQGDAGDSLILSNSSLRECDLGLVELLGPSGQLTNCELDGITSGGTDWGVRAQGSGLLRAFGCEFRTIAGSGTGGPEAAILLSAPSPELDLAQNTFEDCKGAVHAWLTSASGRIANNRVTHPGNLWSSGAGIRVELSGGTGLAIDGNSIADMNWAIETAGDLGWITGNAFDSTGSAPNLVRDDGSSNTWLCNRYIDFSDRNANASFPQAYAVVGGAASSDPAPIPSSLTLRLRNDRPTPGSLYIEVLGGQPGQTVFTAFSPDPANAGFPGTGFWGGLHIPIPSLFILLGNTTSPVFFQTLDGCGRFELALPVNLTGIGPWYANSRAYDAAQLVILSSPVVAVQY